MTSLPYHEILPEVVEWSDLKFGIEHHIYNPNMPGT